LHIVVFIQENKQTYITVIACLQAINCDMTLHEGPMVPRYSQNFSIGRSNVVSGTCKVRNKIETKPTETKRNQHRNQTKLKPKTKLQ
jgi:hypothetical protein